MFHNRGTYQGRAFNRYREERKRDKRQKIAQFAELLAQNMTITAAASRCDVSQQTGSVYFKEICRTMGCQATCQDAACALPKGCKWLRRY